MASAANIKFLSNGGGGPVIDDLSNNVSAFTAAVSGFGGANHTSHKQFIDLSSVSFTSGQIHLSYTSAAGSGTLSAVSGATVVAQIKMIGRRNDWFPYFPAPSTPKSPLGVEILRRWRAMFSLSKTQVTLPSTLVFLT
jgi:hypothetical protein